MVILWLWVLVGVALVLASCAVPRLVGAVWRAVRGEAAFFARTKWLGKPEAGADILLVTAHGWVADLGFIDNAASEVASALASEGAKVDKLMVRYPGNFFSDEDPAELAQEIRLLIARAWAAKPYRRLVFFSHSFGTLLLRQAYLEDRGDPQNRPADAPSWWRHLDRFVQATGVNGGFDRDHRLLIRLGVWFGQWIGRGKLIRASERGTPFIENMRALWVEACQEARRAPDANPIPLVVQLYVSNDELLDESNNVDIASTPKFFVLHVPGANHRNVVDVGWRFMRSRDPWRTRVEAFRLAAIGSETALAAAAREVTHVPSAQEASVTDIVIVAHGIRDRGRWASLFASQIEGVTNGRFAVVTDRFDRASAFTLLFGNRDKNARWFADCYVRARAKYPNADKVHFIGHSYGTYVMAAALTEYPSLRFDRVYLAGSVLPRDFDWSSKIQ